MNQIEYWKEKRVFITGGTSGLGRSLALTLIELGAKVAIMARHKDKVDELIKKASFTHWVTGRYFR